MNSMLKAAEPLIVTVRRARQALAMSPAAELPITIVHQAGLWQPLGPCFRRSLVFTSRGAPSHTVKPPNPPSSGLTAICEMKLATACLLTLAKACSPPRVTNVPTAA